MHSEKEPVKIVRTRFARTRMQPRFVRLALAVMCTLACALAASCSSQQDQQPPRGLDAIDHIIVIYAENRSFDNLYGLFPGANNLANLTSEQYTQIDRDGKPLDVLPPVWKQPKFPNDKPEVDAAYPVKLQNKPFQIDGPLVNRPLSTPTRDLVHRYYQNIEQINGGKNNRFPAVSDAGGLTMGYYDGSKQRMWKWAQENTLADNFFMGAFGGSYLNHQWLVCACTPQYPNAPDSLVAKIDNEGRLARIPDSPASAKDGPPRYVNDGAVTNEGYSVNTQQPSYQPSGTPPAAGGDPRFADPEKSPLPPQTAKTVGDTLSAKGISWVWYGGAWNRALADGMQPPTARRNVIYQDTPGHDNFQPHHQPFNYFARFAPGTADREEHLKDGDDFLKAIDAGTLPQVAFYKPTGDLNEHPGYTDVLSGDQHLADILDRIRNGPLWAKTAVIVAYDENGGFWDHVSPPRGDKWGPGIRIPAIIISPHARHGYVDHTQYDTTSIIKFITRRFGLEPLAGVRETAGDLSNAFDQKPEGRETTAQSFTQWPMVSAIVASFAVIVSLAFYILNFRLTRLSNSAKMVLDLVNIFKSEKMRKQRSSFAQSLLAKDCSLDLRKDAPVLEFFDEVGYLTKLKVLDKGMVWNSFSWWLKPYYLAVTGDPDLGNLIEAARFKSKSSFLFSETEWLYREMCKVERINEGVRQYERWSQANIKSFLEDESKLDVEQK